MISLDDISFYRPPFELPKRPSLPVKTPLVQPKTLPSLHPLPPKPIPQTRLPLSPCQPQLSRPDSASASTCQQSSPPGPSYDNEFDMALAEFDNMAAAATNTIYSGPEISSSDLTEKITKPHLGKADVAPPCTPDAGDPNGLRPMIAVGEGPSDTLPRSAASVPSSRAHGDTEETSSNLGPAGAQHVQSKPPLQKLSVLDKMRDADEMEPGSENSGLFRNRSNSVHMDALRPTDLRRESPGSRIAQQPAGDCATNADSISNATPIRNHSAGIPAANIDGCNTSEIMENMGRQHDSRANLSESSSRQSPAAGSTVPGNATNRDTCTVRENDQAITAAPVSRAEGRPKLRQPKKRGAHQDRKIAVVVPKTTQPRHPQARKPTEKPRRERRKRRTYRSPSLEDDDPDDSDDSDDSDDDDYDEGRNLNVQCRPTKRPRQSSVPNTDRPQWETVIRSQLGGLAFPDLDTMSRETLTYEYFPEQIICQLSWVIGRESCGGFRQTENLPDQASDSREMSSELEDDPQMAPKGKSVKEPWSEQDDAELKWLREDDGLPWSRIKEHFPGRTKGAIMVRYYKKLKGQPVTRALLPTPSGDELNAGTLLSPEGKRRNRRDHGQHSRPAESSPRYGAPRSRRPVERFSPF